MRLSNLPDFHKLIQETGSSGERVITGGTAVRLATLFNTTDEFWMNLQKTYELRLAERALSGKVKKHIEQRREALVSA